MRGWRRVVIAGISIGVGYATIGVVGLASGTPTATPSVYSAVTPVTVLGRSLAAHSNTDVAIAGVGSVPINATSVQLSVTALSGTTTSSLYVYPSGDTQPTSANVRWLSGETVTIPVTVALSGGGKIRLTTDGGTVTVKVAVVGYFSTAPVATGYASSANEAAVVSLGDGGTTIASLDVPAGTYQVQGKAFFVTTDTELVSCFLRDPASANIDDSETQLDSDIGTAPLSLMGFDTTSGGTITIFCDDVNSNTDAFEIKLTAVQLDSASGAITGG